MSHRENRELLSSDFRLGPSYFNHKKSLIEINKVWFLFDLDDALNDISGYIFVVCGHSTENCKMKSNNSWLNILKWKVSYIRKLKDVVY